MSFNSPHHVKRFKEAVRSDDYAYYKFGRTKAGKKYWKTIWVYKRTNSPGGVQLSAEVIFNKGLLAYLKKVRSSKAKWNKTDWGKFT